MDTRSIVGIKTILEEGSFQKAAQRLNCSQSTVTFQVRQLENELSVRLFERLGRRMVFTPAGKSILPHMEAILHSMQAITACNDPASLHGELRVAVAESLLSYKLHALLGDFVERAPAVKLQLHSLNCHDIREGILSGQYDLGVYYDVGGHPHTLEVLPLGQAKGIIVASHLRARDILFRNTIELWSLESIKKTVAANLGVSFLPTFAVEQELATGSLIELPVRMSGCIVQAICVWHKNRESTPAMRLFRDLLQNAALFHM